MRTGPCALRLIMGVILLLLVVISTQAATVYRLKIPEIACRQCTARIENALRDHDGVSRIISDVASQTVTVWVAHGHHLSRREAEALIRGMGFTVRGFTVAGDEPAGGAVNEHPEQGDGMND